MNQQYLTSHLLKARDGNGNRKRASGGTPGSQGMLSATKSSLEAIYQITYRFLLNHKNSLYYFFNTWSGAFQELQTHFKVRNWWSYPLIQPVKWIASLPLSLHRSLLEVGDIWVFLKRAHTHTCNNAHRDMELTQAGVQSQLPARRNFLGLPER